MKYYNLSHFYLDAPRIQRIRSQGKLPQQGKNAKAGRRNPTYMGHYRRSYIPKPDVLVPVQTKQKRRSAWSYFRYGLLGEQVHGINKKISDTYKYGQYTYLGLDFFL